jgi:hypothetical protein
LAIDALGADRRYWSGKGLRAIILAGVLNLGSLAFTILFSAFLLLGVNWKAVLTADCIADVGAVGAAGQPGWFG